MLSCAGGVITRPDILLAQRASQQVVAAATITGTVVDAAGKPQSNVTVKLRKQGGATAPEQTTGSNGGFSFVNVTSESLQVTAERDGEVLSSLTVAAGDSKPVTLVLGGKAAGDGMSFSDAPNFTVAGVTDWTAVGGHGSDATLRTSEDLARTTAALGGMASDAGDTRSAEDQLLQAVVRSPRDYGANLALGEYYLRTAQYADAARVLEVASTVSNGRPEAEYDLALACRGIGDLPKARMHTERAVREADRAEYHRLAGELDEASGDPFAAVRQMERATQLDPSEPNYFAWGSELLLHRAILQADEIYARGAAAYPGSARLRSGWGSALFSEARYDEAARHLCEASDMQPKAAEPYLVLGKADAASPTPLPCVRERLERFLKLEPRNATAHYLLATALLRRNDSAETERAEALLKQSVALDPQYASSYLELGKLAAGRHETTIAIDLYRKAIACDPQLGEAHFRLAALYDRSGRPDEAKQERALHESIEQHRAERVEQERRSVKQFLVVLQEKNAPTAK
jgi:tetratricopeptide (TPR) repeat protein